MCLFNKSQNIYVTKGLTTFFKMSSHADGAYKGGPWAFLWQYYDDYWNHKESNKNRRFMADSNQACV